MNVTDKYEQQRPESLEHLEEFEDMWDGHLGLITMARHRIKLALNHFALSIVPHIEQSVRKDSLLQRKSTTYYKKISLSGLQLNRHVLS